MRRREFITLLGSGVVAWPFCAASQTPSIPVIGFLTSASPGGFTDLLGSFHRGLNDVGYVEGRNVAIEYRWAEGQYGRLSGLAADLVRRRVVLIVSTGGLPSALAAKQATATIPIVFIAGFDPVHEGLVANLSRPGGNATGVSVYTSELINKRLELLAELVPKPKIGVLLNPNTPSGRIDRLELEKARHSIGLQSFVLEASRDDQLDEAFELIKREGGDALLVSADPFFASRRAKIVSLAARYGVPATYPWREYAAAGGLMSYGPSIADAYRQVGDYAGRILRGAKPGDLPVRLPTRFELILNLRTARALGIEVPYPLLITADEVIE